MKQKLQNTIKKRSLQNIIKISDNKNCDIVIVLDSQEWEICPCDIEALDLSSMCKYEYSRNMKDNEYILIDSIRINGEWMTIEEAFKRLNDEEEKKIKETLYN